MPKDSVRTSDLAFLTAAAMCHGNHLFGSLRNSSSMCSLASHADAQVFHRSVNKTTSELTAAWTPLAGACLRCGHVGKYLPKASTEAVCVFPTHPWITVYRRSLVFVVTISIPTLEAKPLDCSRSASPILAPVFTPPRQSMITGFPPSAVETRLAMMSAVRKLQRTTPAPATPVPRRSHDTTTPTS